MWLFHEDQGESWECRMSNEQVVSPDDPDGDLNVDVEFEPAPFIDEGGEDEDA